MLLPEPSRSYSGAYCLISARAAIVGLVSHLPVNSSFYSIRIIFYLVAAVCCHRRRSPFIDDCKHVLLASLACASPLVLHRFDSPQSCRISVYSLPLSTAPGGHTIERVNRSYCITAPLRPQSSLLLLMFKSATLEPSLIDTTAPRQVPHSAY